MYLSKPMELKPYSSQVHMQEILAMPDAPILWEGPKGQWGCFSQMSKSAFKEDGILYPTAEHFFQAEKARKFGDKARLIKILNAKTPYDAKAIGRRIKVNRKAWNEISFDIAIRANWLKFTRSENAAELQQRLLSTGNRFLDEAITRDSEWGLGRTPAMALYHGLAGRNKLGEVLNVVRERLRAEQNIDEDEFGLTAAHYTAVAQQLCQATRE
ncbi:NADAR family protein [Curvularia clavata]|uniref:NADAR family protein n=1 Tax=Curvularia clavata TaxID=95742 RepID=A0A9Q8Z1I8_CURCL|nr:NADAR family protein [Curvularia clavata]